MFPEADSSVGHEPGRQWLSKVSAQVATDRTGLFGVRAANAVSPSWFPRAIALTSYRGAQLA